MNPSEAASFPKMAFVKQRLKRSCLVNISETIKSELDKLTLNKTVKSGQSVAVAVGSRGIDRIDHVVDSCVKFLSDMGFRPFVVPAMGSHGGGIFPQLRETD